MAQKQVVLLGKGDLAIKIGEWFLASRDYDLVAVVPTTVSLREVNDPSAAVW